MPEEERKPFERIYHEDQSPPEKRDRFQVEFTKEERERFSEGQKLIQQHKDATAIKQLAFIGIAAISHQDQKISLIYETLFKNVVNNARLGVDTEQELLNKFQQRLLKFGGKLY